MPKFVDIEPIEKSLLEKMHLSWHRDSDGEYLVTDRLLVLSKEEVKAYEESANQIYAMYEAGAAYVIEKNLFELLDIPEELIESIVKSFQNEREAHLYGRFDLSGGIDGREIKLIEFNADTPTLLLESAVIQWMILQNSTVVHKKQFNRIYDAISKKFDVIVQEKKGLFSTILFSSVSYIDEEIQTTKLLQQMAKDRGYVTSFSTLEEIVLHKDCIGDTFLDCYDVWFKLYPWEEMSDFQTRSKTTTLNPAYTLLYQSKGMLAILYQLFPDSPYLLEASFEPLKGKKYVKKSMFGREGSNIDIVDAKGETVVATTGEYGGYKSIYQEYTPFVKDNEQRHYQAGLFYSDGACGIGFRRGAEILDDMSEFIAHLVDK